MTTIMDVSTLTKLRDTAPNQKLKRQYEMMLDKLTAKEQRKTPAPDTAAATQTEPTPPQNSETVPIITEAQKPEPNETLFQGIGVIAGKVSLVNNRLSIALGGNQFDLRFIPGHSRRRFSLLKQELIQNGEGEFILKVYPKIQHYPDRDKPYSLYFIPLRFERQFGGERKISDPIGEFKLRGFWQYIPACSQSVVSIFRNENETLDKAIKGVNNPKVAQKMTQAQHLPLIWQDAPIEAFKFNPKAETQSERYFIQVKATFEPQAKRFFATDLLAEPTTNAPSFRKPIKPEKKKD